MTTSTAQTYTATIDVTFGIKKPSRLTEDFRTGKKVVSFPSYSVNHFDQTGLAVSYLHEWVNELLKEGETVASYKVNYIAITQDK